MRMTTAALTLRRAGLEDGPFLLTVRNEDSVRSQSKSQGLISEETHKTWLERHLESSGTAIWIIERESNKLGYVRAQKIGSPDKVGPDAHRILRRTGGLLDCRRSTGGIAWRARVLF